MVTILWAKMDKLQLWHAQLTDKSWLQPLKPTRWMVIFIVLTGLIATGMNSYVRYWQYEVWEQNSQLFYLDDGTPLFTTADAPYFLGVAQAIKLAGDFQSYNRMRQYPSATKVPQSTSWGADLRNAPLLSVVISILASDTTPKALLEAGNKLIPITGLLTALMIVFAFGAAGYWTEGSVAAAGGGLSLAYLQRSCAGRIDTDQLNLGFFYLMIGLVIYAARVKSFRNSIVLAALAGATFWIFDWWYSKPFFGWAFYIGFIWLSFVCRANFKRVVLQSILFLGLSGLLQKGLGVSSDSIYLADAVYFEGLIFPNTLDTVTEVMAVPIDEILVRVFGSFWLGLVAIIGLFLWGLRHPALALVFGPAALFGLLNFVIGNRAIFYSAPMLWFGLGWLLFVALKWIGHKIDNQKLSLATYPIAASLGFFVAWLASPVNYVQAPTFERNVISHFKNLGEVLPNENIVIASWWDYGYMSMLMNGKPTLHDGGVQTTPTTHLIANNIIQASQEKAANELKLLGSHGYEGVLANRYSTENFIFKKNPERATIYLVLTHDMTRWMPSISKIGAFDIKAGKPYKFDGVKQGYQLRYDDLKCEPTDINHEFICNGDRLNLVSGQLGNNAILDGMVVSRDGRQTGGRKFPNANTPFVLQSEVGTGANHNLLLHRDLYRSVFHQLFYLNKANPKYFELVYDGFPDIRVFKVQ